MYNTRTVFFCSVWTSATHLDNSHQNSMIVSNCLMIITGEVFLTYKLPSTHFILLQRLLIPSTGSSSSSHTRLWPQLTVSCHPYCTFSDSEGSSMNLYSCLWMQKTSGWPDRKSPRRRANASHSKSVVSSPRYSPLIGWPSGGLHDSSPENEYIWKYINIEALKIVIFWLHAT